jgi:uncharacterized membrane protein YfhO
LEPRREVLLERDLLPPGPRAAFRPATLVRYSACEVQVQAELDAPGYLFLSDAWYPGWRAEADGRPLPVIRANLAFRAVPLPAGSHRVVFQYQPALQQLSSIISLSALVLLVVGAWASWRKSRADRGGREA